MSIYMPVPDKEAWSEIAKQFWQQWNFPNCLGAIDGKHVALQAPPGSGSLYYNYKGFHSIVFLALVDATYLYRVVDVEAYGGSMMEGDSISQRLGEICRGAQLTCQKIMFSQGQRRSVSCHTPW